MFFGRGKELEYLEDLYSKKELTTCSVMGRRGVGKSSIIEEFCRDKRSLDIQFVDESGFENMTLLRMGISQFLDKEIPEYRTMVEYFEIIGDICKESKTVVVLDEFPYLQKHYQAAASIVQRFLDVTVRHTDTMFIICGSSTSVMREETESYSRPLYGRIQNRLIVHPLDISVCNGFHPKMPVKDQLSTYLTVGGIPRYQRKMDKNSFRENITERFLSEKRDMDEEGPAFIRSQIDNATVHLGIVSCIASGTVRQKEIAERMGIDPATCKKALDALESVNIVKRITPMFNAPRKPVYYIEDNFVAFHYQVISGANTLISYNPKVTYDLMENRMNTFLGLRFELLCRDFLLKRYPVKEIGKWWGSVEGEDVDIDIIAKVLREDGTVVNMFCECKYSKRPMGFSALNTLTKRVESLKADNPAFVLFSSGGFDEELTEWAQDNAITLIGPEILISEQNGS